MTNLPHAGDQAIVTNADGTVVITIVEEVESWGIWLTPLQWGIVFVIVAAVATLIIITKRHRSSK